MDVPRGHIQIDDRRGTAWENDEDWLALADPEAVKLGGGLNKVYTAALRMGKKHALSGDGSSQAERGEHAHVLERAKAAAEDYLAHSPEAPGAILLGALARVYGKEEGGADTAM